MPLVASSNHTVAPPFLCDLGCRSQTVVVIKAAAKIRLNEFTATVTHRDCHESPSESGIMLCDLKPISSD